MNRRSFIKVITALGASLAIPVNGETIDKANQYLSLGESPIALIRETISYDIGRDLNIVRFDICTGIDGRLMSENDILIGVDMKIDGGINSCRTMAVSLLEKEMKKRNITWGDLKKLPVVRIAA